MGMFTSCSEDKKDENPKEEISVHPPEWLYGDWYRESDDIKNFKFKSDDFFMLSDKENSSTEFISIKDYIKLVEQGERTKLKLKETHKSNLYRVELIKVANNEPYLVFSYTNLGDKKINYCPFNTDEFKTSEFIETCETFIKK